MPRLYTGILIFKCPNYTGSIVYRLYSSPNQSGHFSSGVPIAYLVLLKHVLRVIDTIINSVARLHEYLLVFYSICSGAK